jgi:HEAT repeat protein
MRLWAGSVLMLCLLMCCGCGRKKTTEELIADLKSSEERDQLIAVRLLPDRKGEASQVIPALIEALKTKGPDIRLSAAIGLGYFGEEARDAIPALKAAQRDRDARVREAAGKALARIDPANYKYQPKTKTAGPAGPKRNQ